MIEKDQVRNDLGKSALDSELEDAVDETTDFSEETEGSVAPEYKTGSEEIDRSDVDERFSKEHSIDEESLRKAKREKLSAGGSSDE